METGRSALARNWFCNLTTELWPVWGGKTRLVVGRIGRARNWFSDLTTQKDQLWPAWGGVLGTGALRSAGKLWELEKL